MKCFEYMIISIHHNNLLIHYHIYVIIEENEAKRNQITLCQKSQSERCHSPLNGCYSSWSSFCLFSEHSISAGSQKKAKEDPGEKIALL